MAETKDVAAKVCGSCRLFVITRTHFNMIDNELGACNNSRSKFYCNTRNCFQPSCGEWQLVAENSTKYKLYQCLQCGRKSVAVISGNPSIAACEPCGGNFLRPVAYNPYDLDAFIKDVEGLKY